MAPFFTGLAVFIYGITFSLNTGYAINPARGMFEIPSLIRTIVVFLTPRCRETLKIPIGYFLGFLQTSFIIQILLNNINDNFLRSSRKFEVTIFVKIIF